MLKYNLLLIEDDSEVAEKLYSTIIQLHPIASVVRTKSLKEGIEKLNSLKFDILILDLNLPDGNGVELLKWLKEKSMNVKTYIFSLNIELKKKCLKLGADSFFDKSTDFEYLIESIAKSNQLSSKFEE